MVDFPKRGTKKESKATEKKSRNFLADAKAEHAELFQHYVSNAGDCDDIEQYTEALQADAWKLTERIAKQSWRNGIARGQSKARKE